MNVQHLTRSLPRTGGHVSLFGCASYQAPSTGEKKCIPVFLPKSLCCPAFTIATNLSLISEEELTCFKHGSCLHSFARVGEIGTYFAAIMCMLQCACCWPVLSWVTYMQRQHVAQKYGIGLSGETDVQGLVQSCICLPCVLFQLNMFLEEQTAKRAPRPVDCKLTSPRNTEALEATSPPSAVVMRRHDAPTTRDQAFLDGPESEPYPLADAPDFVYRLSAKHPDVVNMQPDVQLTTNRLDSAIHPPASESSVYENSRNFFANGDLPPPTTKTKNGSFNSVPGETDFDAPASGVSIPYGSSPQHSMNGYYTPALGSFAEVPRSCGSSRAASLSSNAELPRPSRSADQDPPPTPHPSIATHIPTDQEMTAKLMVNERPVDTTEADQLSDFSTMQLDDLQVPLDGVASGVPTTDPALDDGTAEIRTGGGEFYLTQELVVGHPAVAPGLTSRSNSRQSLHVLSPAGTARAPLDGPPAGDVFTKFGNPLSTWQSGLPQSGEQEALSANDIQDSARDVGVTSTEKMKTMTRAAEIERNRQGLTVRIVPRNVNVNRTSGRLLQSGSRNRIRSMSTTSLTLETAILRDDDC